MWNRSFPVSQHAQYISTWAECVCFMWKRPIHYRRVSSVFRICSSKDINVTQLPTGVTAHFIYSTWSRLQTSNTYWNPVAWNTHNTLKYTRVLQTTTYMSFIWNSFLVLYLKKKKDYNFQIVQSVVYTKPIFTEGFKFLTIFFPFLKQLNHVSFSFAKQSFTFLSNIKTLEWSSAQKRLNEMQTRFYFHQMISVRRDVQVDRHFNWDMSDPFKPCGHLHGLPIISTL